MGMLQEFKKFAFKGNMIDMAVGIIIGAAFGGVVKSLVSDVIMPPIGVLASGLDFKDQAYVLKEAVGENPAVVLSYGNFLNTLINFLIVAFSVFLLVKAINAAKEAFEEEEEKAPKVPTEDILLLREIRDSMKNA